MKRFLPYILIVLIFVQLLAPFTVGGGLKIERNKTEAAESFYSFEMFNPDGDITTQFGPFDSSVACDLARTTQIDYYKERKEPPTVKPCVIIPEDQLKNFSKKDKVAETDTSALPVCMDGLIPRVGGCFAQLLYYALFVPTSYIFALAGTFFDFAFHYSVQDGSYRTPFVVEGWGIVRDFCNMFFIFILLYIAFGTILKLHSVKTKEMIINVVIIGLLINFSLFATQVIVDASNILARVFYNSNTIRITQTEDAANGVANATPGLKIGPNGEIPLSAAIVNKVNPQNLIINGREAVKIQDKFTGEDSDATQTEGNLGTGAFILITLLAVAVNVVGIIAFLSIGLVFVGRVIGLWMAMIFAPFAFFSYTVPSLQDMEMVGWKKWWPETLKMAFLAPVFIFFMYLIIMFLEKGLSLVSSDGSTGGMTFVISIIVPFIFIMILILKAKDIAKKMSGTMGQSITNGIAAVGGLALGGAALGTAMLGRRIIGQTVASASRGDTLSQKFMDPNKRANMNWLQKSGGWVGSLGGTGYGVNKLHDAIGNKLNEKQKKIGTIDHARHEEDEIKKAAGVEGIDNKHLSGENIKAMEGKFNQMKRSEAESAIRKGVDAKGNALLLDDGNGKTVQGEEAFKSAKRKEISDEILADPESSINGDVIEETRKIKKKKINPNTGIIEEIEEEEKTGKKVLTKQGEKKLENNLNIKLAAVVKIAAEEKLAHDFAHIREEASKPVGQLGRAFSKANKGSYDIRDVSNMKTDKREGWFTKVPVALIAGIATGVRAGMKNVGTSNGGIKVQGDFMKDLSSVVSDSFKSMKVNVDISHVGEHKSSADAHGGEHGGGHH